MDNEYIINEAIKHLCHRQLWPLAKSENKNILQESMKLKTRTTRNPNLKEKILLIFSSFFPCKSEN